MAKYLAIVAVALTLMVSVVQAQPAAAAPAPAYVPDPSLSKLLQYFNDPANNLTTYVQVYETGNMEEYFNQSSGITVFAAVDSAWDMAVTRLGQMTGITEEQFYSEDNSVVLGEIIKFNIINSVAKLAAFKTESAWSTLSNLCSNAKNLNVTYTKDMVYLSPAGNTSNPVQATIIGSGAVVGTNIVYLTTDVLIPDDVTIPIGVALTGTSRYATERCPCMNSTAPAPAPAPATGTVSAATAP